MSQEEDEFDDPALRRAIQRAIPAADAPPRLRAKVAALFNAPTEVEESPVDAPSRSRLNISRGPALRVSAAAAVMLIAVGIMVYQIRNNFFPSAEPTATTLTFPDRFAVELIRTHDDCALHGDHHLVPGNDFDALRDSLSKDRGVAVFAAGLEDGWQFKGAGLCDVGGTRAAHLVFTKGDETVSVFSFPAPQSCCGGQSARYAEVANQHPVVGFVNGGAMYCIVGSRAKGEMTLIDVEPLLRKVRTCLGLSGDCQSGKMIMASR